MFDVESGASQEPMHPIVGLLADRDVVWLIPSPWLAEDDWAGATYHRTVSSIRSVAPRHEVIFVANTSAENAHFKRLGLRSFLANQNQFVDRKIFRPLSAPAGRQFAAVYNARFLKNRGPAKKSQRVRKSRRLRITARFAAPSGEVFQYMLPMRGFAAEIHLTRQQA